MNKKLYSKAEQQMVINNSFFRVDNEDFKIGDIIEAKKNYQEKFNETQKEVERILKDKKPDAINIQRAKGLFIFSELSDAIRYLCSNKKKRIYKVSCVEGTVPYHRGDMNWTDLIYKFKIWRNELSTPLQTLNNEEIEKQLATFYWDAFKLTAKPCLETIVNKVKVEEIIIGTDELSKEVCLDYNNKKLNVELMDFYTTQLKDPLPKEKTTNR